MRACIVTSVKNEAAFLLEWLAHHRKVGFDHFVVFSNDCTDGTDEMLDRLQDMGWLTHLPNPGPHPKGAQWSALKAAAAHAGLRAADWLLFSDVDEFVNIHVGARDVTSLVAALPGADAIALTWRLFGNDGVIGYEDRPLTQTFTRAAPATLGWPWRAQMYKTLFRNDGTFGRLGVHRPRDPRPGSDPRWFDGSGRDVTASLAQGRLYSDYRRDNYALAQMNHYALGAMESYLVKADRGRANRDAPAFDLGYWIERNICEAEDRSIEGIDSSELRAALHADPILGALHQSAVSWRKTRFTALMQSDAWRGLFGRLLMVPASRSLPPEVAELIHRHSSR